MCQKFLFISPVSIVNRIGQFTLSLAKLWLLPCTTIFKCVPHLFHSRSARSIILCDSLTHAHTLSNPSKLLIQNTQPLFVFTRILCSVPFIISISRVCSRTLHFCHRFNKADYGMREWERERGKIELNRICLYDVIVWIAMNREDNSKQKQKKIVSTAF